MFKLLLIFLSIISLTYANDELDKLIDDYEDASDYSNITKDDSIGNMVIFTRKDIDLMHANVLSDLFRALKFTNQTQSWKGVGGLSPYGFLSSYPFPIRLYINSTELSSVYTDSPFSLYDNISLNFIDHIEVYFLSSSIKKGSSPTLITIKMYTKDSTRYENGLFQLSASDRGDASLSLFKAISIGNEEKMSIFLNQSTFKGLKINKNNSVVHSKVKEYTHLYADYKNKEHMFSLNYGQAKRGMLFGRSLENAPDFGEHTFKQLLTTYNYDKNGYQLCASYMNEYNLHDEENKMSDGGIGIINKFPNLPLGLYLTSLKVGRVYERFHIDALKDVKTRNNIFSFGIAYERKTTKIVQKELFVNNVKQISNFNEGISSIDNLSLMFENEYRPNDNHKFFLSLKFDKYKGDGLYKDNKDYIAKIGLVSQLSDTLSSKIFLTKSYVNPPRILSQDSGYQLPNLQFKFLSTELLYKNNAHEISSTVVLSEMDNYKIDPTKGKLLALLNEERFVTFNLNYIYSFDRKKSLTFNYDQYVINLNHSPKRGFFLKYTQDETKYSLFSLLKATDSYTSKSVLKKEKKIGKSYDLTLGIKYKLSNSIDISFKGENIFNHSLQLPNYSMDPNEETMFYDIHPRTFMLTFDMEF